MKIALTSDTHGYVPTIPPGVDLVLHAGDIGVDRGTEKNFREDYYPWAERAGVQILATFGNHDWCGQQGRAFLLDAPKNLHFLVDTMVEVGGLKIWFSPWSRRFFDWAYMALESELAQKYALIPDDIDIIVTHGPPEGYGDTTQTHERAGSPSLTKRCGELKKLKLVVTGHIHEAFGEYDMNGVRVLNVSHVNSWYEPTHDPVVVDI